MKKYLKFFLIIFFYIFYNLCAYLPFYFLNIKISSIHPTLFNLYILSIETIFLVFLIFIYYKDIIKYLNNFKHNGKKYFKETFNYWVIGIIVMIISNIIIGIFSPIDMPENEQVVRKALELSPFIILFGSVIEAPIIEEILFRKTIRDIIENKYIYISVSGLAFGAFHIIGAATSLYSWLYIIPYSALGVAFAFSYVKTKNIFTPICLHAFHNLIIVVQLLLVRWI